MKKYLFFYLKTGGGHLAPAKAVAEKIYNKNKGDVEIVLSDGLTNSNRLVKGIIEDGYRNAINKLSWTFEFLYALNKIRIFAVFTSFLVSKFVLKHVEKQILSERPDKIVIFHFFLIRAVSVIIRKHNLHIPVITVVTDPFTAHPLWFLYKNQNYIVFSEMLKEKCIQQGIDGKYLKVFPFVLDQKYSHIPDKTQLTAIRNELGFRPESKIILIMGGGEGMPKGKKILKNILRNNLEAEIAIVCGKNEKMSKHISKLKEKYRLDNLKIYGFIDFIHSLISISDVIITKCGASTFMEILLLGKVQIINNYIWEQEKGNMEYVCNNEMGILEKNSKKIPSVINRLLTDKEYYNSHKNNIRKASLSNGVGPVAEYITEFSI